LAYIYKITNNINGKIYIGKTLYSIEKRWSEHFNDCTRRKNENRPLYRAMIKYGIENFQIEKLEECSEQEVNEREQYWIEKLNSFKYGYNATLGGDGKAYLDRDFLIKTYQEVQNISKTAEILNIDKGHLSTILKNNNIEVLTTKEIATKNYGKIVAMIDLKTNKVIKSFPSMGQAAEYIKVILNKDSASVKGIQAHISHVANGKRKSAYGYSWKFL